MRDAVDEILAQWRSEVPGVDPSPMGVVGRIARLARHFDRGVRDTMAEYGLEPAAFDVLATLRRSGAPYTLTPGELMRTAMVTSGAITQRLDRLEQRGLVTRRRNPDDERSVVVSLTRSGSRLVERVLPSHLETEARLLEGLSSRERNQLAGLLRKLLVAHEQ